MQALLIWSTGVTLSDLAVRPERKFIDKIVYGIRLVGLVRTAHEEVLPYSRCIPVVEAAVVVHQMLRPCKRS